MSKREKHGGRTSVDGEPREKKVAVRESVKSDVERFRNLLDNPNVRDIVLHALDDFEAMAMQANNVCVNG